MPKITKALPIIKWTETFAYFTQRVIGVRTIPLSYVICEAMAVNADAPALMNLQPYSAIHGSVESGGGNPWHFVLGFNQAVPAL
jgi:hypothetical protein